MKIPKKLKIFTVSILAISLLAGCGAKSKSGGASRVDGKTFNFTADEFKNYFNDSAGFFDKKIKDFKGNKMEKTGSYMYSENLGDCTIFASSDTEGGKLNYVSVSVTEGKESKTGTMSKIQLTKNQMSSIEKYSKMVFDVCEPNSDTSNFQEFFDKKLKNASLLADESKQIGDINVSFDSVKWVEFEFASKDKK